jgi:hypothetical protein
VSWHAHPGTGGRRTAKTRPHPTREKLAGHLNRYVIDVARDLDRYAPPPGRKPTNAQELSRGERSSEPVVLPFRARQKS